MQYLVRTKEGRTHIWSGRGDTLCCAWSQGRINLRSVELADEPRGEMCRVCARSLARRERERREDTLRLL